MALHNERFFVNRRFIEIDIDNTVIVSLGFPALHVARWAVEQRNCFDKKEEAALGGSRRSRRRRNRDCVKGEKI